MLEEIRKIRLEELNKEKDEYQQKHDNIFKSYHDLCEKAGELQVQGAGMIEIEHFSLLERLITRRRRYKEYKEKVKRMEKLPKLIEALNMEMEVEFKKCLEELETSGVGKKIDDISEKIKEAQQAETLLDMGITPLEAIKILEDNGIEPVLSEDDKGITYHPRDYSTKASLIGVHKTRYMPMGNVIKSSKDANVENKSTVTLNGTEYTITYKFERDTVHMAMNDEVSSHMYGSWDDCEYAVLIPLEDIPNEKIGRAATVDTFTRGSLELSENTWILCPKSEVDKLRKLDTRVHVLGYEGKNVKGYTQPFLTQLGYRAEDVGMWNWSDSTSAKQYYDLMKKENIRTGMHTYTYFHEDEEMKTLINKAVSLCKLLRDEHLIKSPEDLESIIKQLNDKSRSFGDILSKLCIESEDKEDAEPQSIVANHRQVDLFVEEMRKNGFNISPAYHEVLKNLIGIPITFYRESDIDTVFKISSETSKEEKDTIEELKFALEKEDGDHEGDLRKFINVIIGDSILHSKEKELGRNNESNNEELTM